MKKYLILLIVVLCVAQTAIGFTIKGGVSYTVNEARQIAFDGVPKKIDMSKYKEYFVDKNYEKNMKLLNEGKTRYRGRILAFFLIRLIRFVIQRIGELHIIIAK